MSYGYTGNILHLDLSSKKHWIEHPSETFYRTYWGGRALALYYMLTQMKPHTNPLSPDNLLIFAPSVLTGTPAPAIPRYTVCARSPLTGAQGFLKAGGELAGFIIVSSGLDRYDMHNPWAWDRKIQKGEQVLFDFGGVYNNYFSDIQRIFFMDPIHDKQRELQEKAMSIYYASLEKAKPGNTIEEMDIAASKEIKRLDVESLVFHRTGHSLGLEIQELPSVSLGEKTILEPGMCFAIEPGIYDYAYGSFKIENDIVITENGYENLNNCNFEIVEVK